MMNRKVKQRISISVKLILVAIIMLFMVLPFLICIGYTFKSEGEINSLIPYIIPRNPTLANVRELFADKNFLIGVMNSMKIAVVTMFSSLLIAFPAAYAIARIRTKVAPMIQVWILLSQMIPIITLSVPLYMILKSISITNTHLGLILVYTVWSIPCTLWLLKGFVTGFPKELEEAAYIDGCNTPRMFFRILLPNILPGVLTAGIFAFIGTWNEFFFALCFLKSPEKLTLSMTLYSYIGLAGQARDGMLAAASLFSAIPGVIVFSFFQRYYISGMTEGSIK